MRVVGRTHNSNDRPVAFVYVAKSRSCRVLERYLTFFTSVSVVSVSPSGIPIAIRLGGCLAVLRAGFGEDISGGIVGIGDGAGDVALGRALAVVIGLLGELILHVVFIGDERIEVSGALGDARNVAEGIVGILLALEKCTIAIASGGRMPRRPQFSRPDVWNFFRNRAFGRLFDSLECQHRISTVP